LVGLAHFLRLPAPDFDYRIGIIQRHPDFNQLPF
jgi:hypothetical protein